MPETRLPMCEPGGNKESGDMENKFTFYSPYFHTTFETFLLYVKLNKSIGSGHLLLHRTTTWAALRY